MPVIDCTELLAICALLEQGGEAREEAETRLLALETPLAFSDAADDRRLLDALAGARSEAMASPQRSKHLLTCGHAAPR